MASIFLTVHPAKGSQEQFSDSLRGLVESKSNISGWPSVLPELDATKVTQCVVGPNHLAFLFQDGRVCRVPFHVSADKAESNYKDPSDEETSATCANKSPTYSPYVPPQGSTSTIYTEVLSSLSGQLGWTAANIASTSTGSTTVGTPTTNTARVTAPRGRGRIVRAARGRAGGSWLSGRAVIPASAVPEDLVAQAQVVLQGKSRQVIIRELQKTNLDVNLAVNNLLSRDDDEPEDQDEEGYLQDAYIPSEDLISIFEAGIPTEDIPFTVQRDALFPEDLVYNPTFARPESRASTRPNVGDSAPASSARDVNSSDAAFSSRMRERWWGMLMSDNKEKAPKISKPSPSSKPKVPVGEAVQRFGEVEWWNTEEVPGEGSLRFVQIASLHSELIAVTSDMCLYQWKWCDVRSQKLVPGHHGHPRAEYLKLKDEKVVNLAACNIRATVLTESGKLATWLDECLSCVGHKLEHPAQVFPELKLQAVALLDVCDLYSCVQLASGALYWWGVFPFEQRKKILDKVKAKAKKSAISGSSLIKVGTQVCIRSCPLYYPGAVGFTTVNGEPRVGELVEQAWTITEKCRFKLMGSDLPDKDSEESRSDHMESEEKMDLEEGELSSKDCVSSPVLRKRKLTGDVEDSGSQSGAKEESWCLKDVIFVEDIRNVPVGKVLKVDGAYALVNFSSKLLHEDSGSDDAKDLAAVLKDCRLVRKDELQIVKWTSPPKMPECIQRAPKQLLLPGMCKIIAIALDTKGVHALLKSSSGLRYVVFSLASCRPEPGGLIQREPSYFLSQNNPALPTLHSSGLESYILMRDPNGCIYPLVKDNLGGIRNPYWMNVPAVSSLAMGRKKCDDALNGKSVLIVTVMVIQENELIQHVLKSDSEAVQQFLKSVEGQTALAQKFVNAKCDGNRNIVHVCVSTCQPTSTKSKQSELGLASAGPAPGSSTAHEGSQIRYSKALELMRSAFSATAMSRSQRDVSESLDVPIPTATWPPEPAEEDEHEQVYEPSLWVPLFDGATCLEVLLKSPVLEKQLYVLLSERDAFGCTPFMLAIRIRAYHAAVKLFDAAVQVSTNGGKTARNNEVFMSMICPPGTDKDMSPLHMLCCNDTCSFTWTGTNHINQDIFECKTCALVGPLCCCTECARVCHQGHECKLKRTSPTAYCDCWEKCPCKALIPGDQARRLELLHKLVQETDLVTKPNKMGEHILLFLVQTVARQATEQLQYVSSRLAADPKQRSSSAVKLRSRAQTPPLPDHDLEPPRFAKTSLQFILKNWKALKSMIMFGSKSVEGSSAKVVEMDDNIMSAAMLQSDEIEKYLKSQEGTALLDNFVHKLIVKCNAEHLEILLQSFQKRMLDVKGSQEDEADVSVVARRFIRSVARVFVVLSACVGPNYSKRKSVLTSISKCKRAFVSLNVLAAQELANMAGAVFAPVRMGVVYPSAPFTLGSVPDSAQASDELFSVAPLPERMPSPSSNPNGHPHRVTFDDRTREASVPREEEDADTETEDVHSQSQSSHGEELTEHADAEMDLLAESESDSEESGSEAPRDSQRNSAGPSDDMVGSRRSRIPDADGDGYFSVAETSDAASIEAEDDDEDEDEDEDEDDEEENENQAESTEQRQSVGGDNPTPHALQWAVRHSSPAGASASAATTTAHVSGSGLVFIDTANLRRVGSGASASGEGLASGSSMYCTPSGLARTFSILVREVSDLLTLSPGSCSLSGACMPIEASQMGQARQVTDEHLLTTWEWLWRVMETTEAQLRFGASLTAATDPSHPQHPLYESQSKSKPTRSSNTSNILRTWNESRRKKRGGGAAGATAGSESSTLRQDFLSYILSLMRSHDNEHANSLPKVDITSLRHVAYVLDAFIYYLRSNQDAAKLSPDANDSSEVDYEDQYRKEDDAKEEKGDTRPTGSVLRIDYDDDDDDDTDQNEDEAMPDAELKVARHRFFRRSDSTLVLGYEATEPFTTCLRDALPLAERPHLLNPTARRDQLFGVISSADSGSYPDTPINMKLDGNAGGSGSVSASSKCTSMSANFYLGRWRMCLELFGRVFLDDVGAEPSSVLNELGRFEVKEAKFRREMEKLRNSHQKDLYIEGLDRDQSALLQQSLRQLNSQFGRRVPGAGPLNIHRLKVSFKDEPGEGSGVVRSFYTAVGEAFLADEKLPCLENIFSGSRGLTHQLKARARERERERRRSDSPGSSLSSRASRRERDRSRSDQDGGRLSLDAKPYVIEQDAEDGLSDRDDYGLSEIPVHKRVLGKRIFARVNAYYPSKVHAGKITGMLLELSPTQLIFMLTHDEAFRDRMAEAYGMIVAAEKGSGSGSSSKTSLPPRQGHDERTSTCVEDDEDSPDNAPLFYQPGKAGYYSPRPGRNGPERLNCFRNVGRVIGLCLLQNELSPIVLNRHVIKYLLGRRIGWHDLAFFDPTLYESLRQLMEDAQRPDATELFSALDLTYCIQMRAEEGRGSVELIRGGGQVEVAPENVHDYVKRYAEYRMVTVARRPLQAMRRGLLDVIPAQLLEGLTSEDFRLLLNGAGDIVVQQLMGYTFFSDETGGEGQEKLSKFKKWFWSIVDSMSTKQKQDLLYFWTSSPAMPASAEGFQPMPSVTVKPANEHQLPTANTCISRLYVPLYSSKATLRSKLLLAIRTKVFGFV